MWDAIALLRHKIFRHGAVLTQSLLVVVLGLMAVFAGPIARFNTHRGMATPERDVQGLMASRSFFCSSDDVLRVRDIWHSLDRAGFPKDQLLDWLPSMDVDWGFNAGDWANSTWEAECDYTKHETNLNLTGTGVYNGTEGWPTKFYELDGLWETLAGDEDFKNKGYLMTFTGGNQKGGVWLEVIMWIYAVIINEDDNGMKMALVSMYLDHPPTANNTDEHDFGIGKVPNAYYTKASCHLRRNARTVYQAYPDVYVENACVAEQAATYFFASALTSGLKGIEIHLPSGEEIWRWYQSYTISKDTYHKHPNVRDMEVRIPTVEISAVFLALGSLVTLIVLVGLVRYAVFRWKYKEVFMNVPETKVDWVLYSHRAKGRRGLESVYGSNVELVPPTRDDDPWNASRWSLNRLDTAYRPLNEQQSEQQKDDRWLLQRGNSDYEPLGGVEPSYGGVGRTDERSIL